MRDILPTHPSIDNCDSVEAVTWTWRCVPKICANIGEADDLRDFDTIAGPWRYSLRQTIRKCPWKGINQYRACGKPAPHSGVFWSLYIVVRKKNSHDLGKLSNSIDMWRVSKLHAADIIHIQPMIIKIIRRHAALFVVPMPYTLLSGNQNNHIEVFYVILHGEHYVAMLMIFYR